MRYNLISFRILPQSPRRFFSSVSQIHGKVWDFPLPQTENKNHKSSHTMYTVDGFIRDKAVEEGSWRIPIYLVSRSTISETLSHLPASSNLHVFLLSQWTCEGQYLIHACYMGPASYLPHPGHSTNIRWIAVEDTREMSLGLIQDRATTKCVTGKA